MIYEPGRSLRRAVEQVELFHLTVHLIPFCPQPIVSAQKQTRSSQFFACPVASPINL